MRRIVLFILIISVLGFCSTGCSTYKKSEKALETTENKPVEITFCRPQASEPEDMHYKEAVSKFNKLNEGRISLNMEVITRGNSFAYEEKINTAIASKSLSDLLLVDSPNIAYYYESNAITPLDDCFTEKELEDFSPSVIRQGTYKDKLVAICQSDTTVVLFYNKKIMREKGILPPTRSEDAWTWEKWYDVMKKCAGNGITGTNIITDKGEWMTYCFEQFWISNKTDILNKKGTQAEGYVNGEKGIEAAEFLAKLAREKLFNIDPSPYEFEEGKAATKLGGPWNISHFNEFPELEWGVTYFPKKENGVLTSSTGGWSFSITPYTAHRKEAIEALRYLCNVENSIALAKAISTPPNRLSAYNSLKEYETTAYKIIKDQVLNYSHPRPVTTAYPVLSQRFSEALLDIFMGAEIKQSLDNVARTYDNEYKSLIDK